jgi:phospholipid/cholesterol/gamma-HCH transport system substrate-binding protein
MRRPNYFKIGLFVLSAAFIVVVAVIAFGVGAFFEERIRVETYFTETVQGLDIGSPVKYRGVEVGRVEEMTVVRNEYRTRHRYVLIRMALNKEGFLGVSERATEQIEREVEQGLRVRLGFQGVTGAAYIEIDYLDPERHPPLEIDWSPKHPYIPASPSIIARVGDAVDGILRNLEKINVEGIAGALEESLQALARILNDTDVTEIGSQAELLLKELRETNRHLAEAVRDLDFKPLLAGAETTMESLRGLAERTEEPLLDFLQNSSEAARHLDDILEQLAISGDLPESMAHLNRLLGRLDRLIYGQQRQIEMTIDNLQEMSENFRELSESARENPSQFIFGAPPPRRSPGEMR